MNHYVCGRKRSTDAVVREEVLAAQPAKRGVVAWVADRFLRGCRWCGWGEDQRRTFR